MPRIPGLGLAVLLLLVVLAVAGGLPSIGDEDGRPAIVPVDRIHVDDGDTISIRWDAGVETVRLLGIDTPEVRHLEHDIPFDQPFGREASAFLRGCLATTQQAQLVRAAEKDPYDRTLGYLLLDGASYAVLAIEAGLAVENVSHFGDNGLPDLAAEVTAAARRARPAPFEPPHIFRRRMRDVSRWMKAQGRWPRAPERAEDGTAPGR